MSHCATRIDNSNNNGVGSCPRKRSGVERVEGASGASVGVARGRGRTAPSRTTTTPPVPVQAGASHPQHVAPRQAMASPSMVQRSGDTLIVRSVVSGDRLYLESGAPVAEPSPPASPPIQDEVDETELPQCKIKRNYDCADCDYFTQNPRHYLSHLRDVHGEKVKIYDCPHCLYASKHYQKLLRHMKMVHGVGKGAEEATAEVERKRRAPKAEPEPEEECDLEDPESGGEPGPAKKAKTELECSMCDFAANSHNQLTRHERKEHLKTKFFPCSKCNYVTHIKARFTKHVKYHSMPMIKCEVCDFRTPYKWNLDRHMKNHGGTGAFCCSACNFTADIKQSLTVHEMNHHVPAVGGGAAGGGGSNGTPPPPRRRNRVGGSDSLPAVGPSSPRAPRARRSRPRSKPAELERISPEPESFSDLAEITLAERVEPEEEPKAPKKTPRPIPNLIPLQVNGVPPPLKSATPLDLCTSFKNEDNDEEQQSRPTLKKKSTSIFEKLYKEKLMTVGDDRISPKPPSVEGKRINGLSTETSRISGSGSTRCQRCRHRCKSSNDLVLHMQTCVAKRDEAEAPAIPASEEEGSADDPQAPHPMENVVFVWNSMLKKTDSFDDSEQHFDGAAVASSSTPKREKEAAGGKRVFKCPHCSFWASTASRFHVHIVGHLNRKPFECSLCSYKSNWRWDITKHIRLKSVRDPDHAKARVLMTDETGRRNYNAFETDMQPATSGDNVKPFVDIKLDERKNTNEVCVEAKKTKKTMWKCKKCDYRNASKDALLMHVRKHSKSSAAQPRQEKQADASDMSEVSGASDVSSISYRCGHCNQRHCRLKHNGDVKVVVGMKNSCDKQSNSPNGASSYDMKCSKCPFTTTTKYLYESHLKQHTINSDSNFKCFICPYYVKSETDLIQHLPLHGISEPEKYGAQIVNCKPPVGETVQMKRYRCSDCPYESNSKSQFTYHEQFHKAHNAPFKCEICNYQVTKRHLLHQHMKVHGFTLSNIISIEPNAQSTSQSIDDLTLMWVSHNGEFQKMYKCRSCPYINLRKNNIYDHEKLHNSNIEYIHKCADCNYACNNLDVYISHTKVHRDDYAKVYYPVDMTKTDEVQILELKDSRNEDECCRSDKDNKKLVKMLYFCSDCPARFLFEKELQIHYKFHCLRLPYQCVNCSYTARQHAHLLAHNNVHSKEFQDKTKSLQELHSTNPEHPQPKIVAVMLDLNDANPVWIAVADINKQNETVEPVQEAPVKNSGAKQHMCNQCPARFFKSAALNYHITLHGGEGLYKCRQCDYAVKTVGNLAKHEVVHGPASQADYESGDDLSLKNVPISGTDLYQQKTKAEKRALSEKLITRPNDHFPPVLQADPQFGLLMHGNPDFIYPTYLKNGRPKEKRYKCHKCPSAFEKREQYKVHLSLHGSKQRYKCEICDYSVKYYANYVQHMRKHQMNADAQAARQGSNKSDAVETISKKSDTKFAIKSLPKQTYKDSSKMSISDQQTLRLLHRRRSSVASAKEVVDERKVYRCTHCPYTNQRRDALDNHTRRHATVSGVNTNFMCHYCDYAAPQSQFLRDHMKVHFHQPKHINPEYFANFEGLEIFISKIYDKETDAPIDSKKHLFTIKENLDISNLNESGNKIYVVPTSGERVQ